MKMRGRRKMQSYKSWCNCTFCSGLAQVSRVVEKEEARKEIQEQLEDLAMIEEAEYLFDGTLVPLDEVLVDVDTEEEVSGETNPYWKSVVVEADYDELTLEEAFAYVMKSLEITYEEEEPDNLGFTCCDMGTGHDLDCPQAVLEDEL